MSDSPRPTPSGDSRSASTHGSRGRGAPGARTGLDGASVSVWSSSHPSRCSCSSPSRRCFRSGSSEGHLFAYGLYTMLYVGARPRAERRGRLRRPARPRATSRSTASAPTCTPSSPRLTTGSTGRPWSDPARDGRDVLPGSSLGLPSRRLLGDYLAIVTLFFGQASSSSRRRRSGLIGFGASTTSPAARTGIPSVDTLAFFGPRRSTSGARLLLLVGFVGLLIGAALLS